MPKTTKTKRNRFHQSPLTSSHSSQSTNSNSNKHNNPNANSNSNSNANANATASLNANTSELSRGQRKRNAKREQYLKREKMILSTLSLKRKEDQTKRIDGLDALKEALEGVMNKPTTQTEASTTNTNITSNTNNNNNNTKTTTTTKIPSMTTNKAKQNLAVNEITHMNLVLQHPSFRSNPMETIKEHLKNTLAEQMKDQSITKHGESLKSRTKKKKVISKKSIHSKYNHKQMKASKNKKRNVQK